MSIGTLARFTAFASVTAFVFGLADLLFSWNPLASGPYLLHRTEPVFRNPPALLLGVVAEICNGWIVTAGFWLVDPSLRGSPWRRGLQFGLLVAGLWVVSGTFSAMVWLAVPASVALANIGAGIPKALTIGCAVAWTWHWLPLRSVDLPIQGEKQRR